MPQPTHNRARVAVDLGAESCRVSLLRWNDGVPSIELMHRIPNGPVHRGSSLHWPLANILAGVEEGLRKAADFAPEGIASIAVDGWAVDYVRLDLHGRPLHDPFCYRDERSIVAKEFADARVNPDRMFRIGGAQPLRINTAYQLVADQLNGTDARAPWVGLPEYVLHRLGGRRVAEYTNATHTGLVDIATHNWSAELFEILEIPIESAPPIVPAGSSLGQLQGPLASLAAFRDTELIAPACHDTASAIAGIPTRLGACAYICSGTWSLIGTLVGTPVTSPEALASRYTNQGAAANAFCFHSNVNGMWMLKQCMDGWASEGRPQTIEDLVERAASRAAETIDVDAEQLLLDRHMPERINQELTQHGHSPIPDIPGNEPAFARVIFESLACRYAESLAQLQSILGSKIDRIHVIGGGSRNKLLIDLTVKRTGLPVEAGQAESSTIGNFAVQLAATEHPGAALSADAVRHWAALLTQIQ
jgi:rhamnulokinase